MSALNKIAFISFSDTPDAPKLEVYFVSWQIEEDYRESIRNHWQDTDVHTVESLFRYKGIETLKAIDLSRKAEFIYLLDKDFKPLLHSGISVRHKEVNFDIEEKEFSFFFRFNSEPDSEISNFLRQNPEANEMD
jgi:hypothetical protein